MSATRRQVVIAAAGSAIAVPLARAVPAPAAISGDAAVLTQVARVALLLRHTYAASVDGLDGAPQLQATFRLFAAQEAEHLGALATSLEALGAPKPPGPASPAEAARLATQLGVEATFPGPAASPRDAVRFALAAEDVAGRTLERAAARLGDLNLMQTALTILGCQAQHAAVLRAALGRGPVRSAVIRS